MNDERRGDELRAIWQSQPTGTSAITMALLRSKAQTLQAQTRRQMLGTAGVPLAAACLYAFAIGQFPALRHVLHLLFAFTIVWSLAGLYFLNRGMWSTVMPGDAGLSTGLEFCRGEIERRRNLLRRVLLWSLGPVLLAIGTFILALAMMPTTDRGLFPHGLPFVAVVAVWILGCVVIRAREHRALARELDELSDVEKENRR